MPILPAYLKKHCFAKIRETRFAQTCGFLNARHRFFILRSVCLQKWPPRNEKQRENERITIKHFSSSSHPRRSPFDHYGIRRSEGWKQAFLALKSLHCLSVASLQTLARGGCFQGGGRTGLDFLVTFGSSQK